MTLRESTLSPVCLFPDGNVAKLLELKYLLRFRRPREGDEEQGEVSRCCFLGRRPAGSRHQCDPNYVKP
jgi:hypothetical protein